MWLKRTLHQRLLFYLIFCLREEKPNIDGRRIPLNKKIRQFAKKLNVSI